MGGYAAFHAGTTESDSDIEGFHEALSLAGGRPVHLAHINSYCRGLRKDVLTETQEAVQGLVSHPNVCSESYLGSINAASGKCSGGIPESKLTRKWLEVGGFEPTQKGMEEAVMAGWALINMEKDGQVVLASGGRRASVVEKPGHEYRCQLQRESARAAHPPGDR